MISLTLRCNDRISISLQLVTPKNAKRVFCKQAHVCNLCLVNKGFYISFETSSVKRLRCSQGPIVKSKMINQVIKSNQQLWKHVPWSRSRGFTYHVQRDACVSHLLSLSLSRSYSFGLHLSLYLSFMHALSLSLHFLLTQENLHWFQAVFFNSFSCLKPIKQFGNWQQSN